MTTSTATEVRWAENKPVSQQVIYALAQATDADPTEMEPVHYAVDLEALDQIFQTGPGPSPSARVDFTANGCDVTVHAGGEVTVTPTTD